MGIVGSGTLGKRIQGITKTTGTSILMEERKETSPTSIRTGRTEFYSTVKTNSVVDVCCSLDHTTCGMIGEAQLRHMDGEAMLANVSHGGVVDELALVTVLREHWITGAATDVFAVNLRVPFRADGIPNLTMSPHVACYTDSSIENLKRSRAILRASLGACS